MAEATRLRLPIGDCQFPIKMWPSLNSKYLLLILICVIRVYLWLKRLLLSYAPKLMKRVSKHLPQDTTYSRWLAQLIVVLVPLFVILVANASSVSAAPCPRTEATQNIWVARSVDDLVRTAQIAYRIEYAREKHDRVVQGIASTIARCQLSKDREFARRYPEFLEYVRVLLLSTRPDRELGFEVPDHTYFAETGKYTGIPDFLLTNTFLRAVSSFETLPMAKALLRELNAGRAATEQLVFFSYVSQHLGAPDNPDSFLRLLIVVPGNEAQRIPEKWIQFAIPDPRKPKVCGTFL